MNLIKLQPRLLRFAPLANLWSLISYMNILLIVSVLHGCATSSPEEPPASGELSQKLTEAMEAAAQPVVPSVSPQATIDALQASPQADEPKVVILPGTGEFINRQSSNGDTIGGVERDGQVTLNFEAAAIGEVVKVIFDILEENYVIDPRVRGEVTVQTGRPIAKEMLIPTLETLLRLNNAALVYSDGIYKIVPATNALPGNVAPQLEGMRPGYGVQVVPLRYIAAEEMAKILEPLLPRGSILYIDSTRNLLMLSGSAQELANAQETINLFDVNWLEGMSIGMYRLQNVDSGTIVADLSNLFGENSEMPGAGLFRFLPVSQINAVIAITPQAAYLDEIGEWIERLDGAGGERLYVYQVQNGDAEYLASVLAEVFGTQGGGAVSTTVGQVAPGLQPTELEASPQQDLQEDRQDAAEGSPGLGGGGDRGDIEGGGDTEEGTDIRAQQAVLGTPSIGGRTAGSVAGRSMEDVRIIPDVENNTLLIWANNFTYEKILDALRKLDITPRQVLVEVTIAEVTLTGELQYGLQWFFKNNVDEYQGRGALGLEVDRPVSGPGGVLTNVADTTFAYALSKDGVVRLLLQTLAGESKVKILSSPQIMVIDNQEAEIRVGTEQPVLTATTVTEGGNTVESIEFKQTGVLLTVSPQVNVGGLITMDVVQEVTDVGEIDQATGQRAFLTREVKSKVAVQSGETIVLGGLISETQRDSRGGVPILYKTPVIGPLFGTTVNEGQRTELLIVITPQVARDNQEAIQVTEELKERMRGVVPFMEEHLEGKPTRSSTRF